MREIHEGHGPDCTCGCHDYEKNRAAEQGRDCAAELGHDHDVDCGHDYDHNDHGHHGHDHGHHGHDHGHHGHHDHAHHAHEGSHGRTVEFGWGDADLESHTHDQAATVSATIHTQPNAGKTFEALVGAMQEIAQQVESAGGIVGHIKAYVRTEESFAHASSTDAQHPPACEGDAQMVLDSDADCQLVAIALLIDLDQLEHIVVAALA